MSEHKKSNFAFAFSGLSLEQKRALTAVYSYCRLMDDLVDEAEDITLATEGLRKWKKIIRDINNNNNPIAIEMAWAIERYGIQNENLLWLIEGVSKDLRPVPFQTWNDLFAYSDAVATSVGLMCLPIFGQSVEPAKAYAYETGRALQLTNICRDIFEDAKMHRIYIPKEHWELFGLTEQDFYNGQWSQSFENMVKGFCQVIAQHYDRTENYKMGLNPKNIWPAEVMRKIYQKLFSKIQKNPKRIIQGKVSVGFLTKAWIAKREQWKSRSM